MSSSLVRSRQQVWLLRRAPALLSQLLPALPLGVQPDRVPLLASQALERQLCRCRSRDYRNLTLQALHMSCRSLRWLSTAEQIFEQEFVLSAYHMQFKQPIGVYTEEDQYEVFSFSCCRVF
jgi:hypothetical protein